MGDRVGVKEGDPDFFVVAEFIRRLKSVPPIGLLDQCFRWRLLQSKYGWSAAHSQSEALGDLLYRATD